MSAKKFLIVITGPTAIGKTKLAIELKNHFDSFIISADSRQIYKELSIGTAKPSAAEIESGNIKLVDHISITEDYSAGRFMDEALPLIDKGHELNQLPILCGGTGLYIKAVCEGLDAKPQVNKKVIDQLNAELKDLGIEHLQKELKSKDPQYYEITDTQNGYRLVRALSIIRETNKPYSSFHNLSRPERPFIPIYIVLGMDRPVLYEKINNRVTHMMATGLLDEVAGLRAYQHLPSLNTVGYKELFDYLDGKVSLEEAVALIQRNSRRYAKRQMTWNRNQISKVVFHPERIDLIVSEIERRLNQG